MNDDLLDDETNDSIEDDDSNIKFVYPYGQSLDTAQTVSVVFNSGIISYPANRALTACSVLKKGKIFVVGSERFFEDEFIDKEENKKIAVILFYIYIIII
jgi:hypothetical protein